MNEEIKVGDVVKLKGGGPKMTIATIWGADQTVAKCKCQWFISNMLLDGEFALAALELA